MSDLILQLRREIIRVQVSPSPLQIKTIGIPGGAILPPPPLPQFEMAYSYGNVTPKFLLTVPAGKRVLSIELTVEVPFDGVGASLSIGTLANPDQLVTAEQNNPYEVACYEICADVLYTSAAVLYLTINPGTDPTQGSGFIKIDIQD